MPFDVDQFDELHMGDDVHIKQLDHTYYDFVEEEIDLIAQDILCGDALAEKV